MHQQQLIEHTTLHFKEKFQKDPDAIYLSPGRINIIGEHIDYNDGFVLPAAIDKYVCLSMSHSKNSTAEIVAIDLDQRYTFDIKDAIVPSEHLWMNYLLGVMSACMQRGYRIEPFQMAFSSTVPIGAGLSSSAAVSCGFAFALNDLFQWGITKKELALIGQEAEHEFAGVKCGIMDQFACIFGEANKAIKLDCRSMEYEYINAELVDYIFVLLDSCVKHTHLTSGYNQRRIEVESGLKMISNAFPEIKSFRDCTLEMIEKVKSEMSDTIYKRCRFVIDEIQRVETAAMALQKKSYPLLGKTMTETHWGLSEKYEVSCAELDFLVEQALSEKGVLGARMMGGGFGGCTINLVHKENAAELIHNVGILHQQQFGIDMKHYEVNISEGTRKYQS